MIKDILFWIAIGAALALAVHMYTHDDQVYPPCARGTIANLTTSNCEAY